MWIKFEHDNQCQTIEAYQNEVRTLEWNIATWGIVELVCRNPNVANYMHSLGRTRNKGRKENDKLRGLLAKGDLNCVDGGLPKKGYGKVLLWIPWMRQADDLIGGE